MAKQPSRIILPVILILSILTAVVFRYPQKTSSVVQKVINTGNSSWTKEVQKKHGANIIPTFLSKIASFDFYKVNSSATLDAKISGLLLPTPGIDVVLGSVLFSGESIVDTTTKKEIRTYNTYVDSTILSNENPDSFITYSITNRVHNDGKRGYFKVVQQDLQQDGTLLPILLVRQGIINEYVGTWVGGEGPLFSLQNRFEQNTKNLRFLELSRDHSFIEIQGEGLVFSGNATNDGAFSGTLLLPKYGISGSLKSLTDTTFELILRQSEAQNTTFRGIVTLSSSTKQSVATIEGTIKRPAGIELDILLNLEFKKLQKAKITDPPVRWIPYKKVQNTLGILPVGLFGNFETIPSENTSDTE